MPPRPTALLLAALALAPPAMAFQEEPGVAALVKRCVDAHGGAKALAQARIRREVGSVTSLLHPGQPGRLLRVYDRAGGLRVEIAFPGDAPEVRVLTGGRGWRSGEEVEGPPLVAMILQAARLDLPALLQAKAARVTDGGTFKLGERTLRVLRLEVAPGLVVEADVDPQTGRILRSSGRASGQGPPVEFVTTYQDYRSVGGILVAFREGNWANGRTTGETVLQEVELLERLPAGALRP